MSTHHNIVSTSDDDILALTPMKSIKKAASVQLTTSLFWMLFQKEMLPKAAVCVGRMIAITIEEGFLRSMVTC
eukprot:3281609-Ditylum_brightwellii.AAC.1